MEKTVWNGWKKDGIKNQGKIYSQVTERIEAGPVNSQLRLSVLNTDTKIKTTSYIHFQQTPSVKKEFFKSQCDY